MFYGISRPEVAVAAGLVSHADQHTLGCDPPAEDQTVLTTGKESPHR